MKTKTLLVSSVLLNFTLLGAVAYLSRQIPEPNFMPADAGFVVESGFDENFGFTNRSSDDLQFGIVEEVLLPSPADSQRSQLYDLETGRRLLEPDAAFFGHDALANIAWIRTNGLDISGLVLAGEEAMCICYYMAVVPAASRSWHEVQTADVVAAPELAKIHNPKRSVIGRKRFGTDTFLFRTTSGTTGVLQVLGTTTDRRNVKIRYKLAQSSRPPSEESAVSSTTGAESQEQPAFR